MNGDVIKWQVSDSTGSDRFFTITSGFLRGADVILLTFDLSSEETFLSMDTWMNEVKSKARPNVLPVLVGCKSDGEQQVQEDIIHDFASKHKVSYFETSAKDNLGIEQMFESIGLEYMDKQAATKGGRPSRAFRGKGAFHFGYLIKRGTRWPHKWQRRWFVLDDELLSYSRDDAPESAILAAARAPCPALR